jgi:hypothetical protein
MMFTETGNFFPLKEVSGGHWNSLVMVTDIGYYFSLETRSDGH